ncbi:MAG: TonB-dependent receptor, partial [Deltaproteobacteria bacterium]|nr:TonB-dependent receptor [Deltaproteobacteria bacterium]
VDKNYLNASNIGEVEARHLHNAGISYRPFDWLTATLEVQNITDKQYADFYGFPLPGRSYFGTIRIAF